MIFTSLSFLGFFLSLLAAFFLIRRTTSRQYFLLLASYVFYGAWNVNYLLLITLCSFWGWGLGLLMHRADNLGQKKLYMATSIALSLSMLGYFKYANFFADSVSNLFNLKWDYIDILLPVGISFFSFQTMSYTIDLYRGNIGVCKSLPKFMLFVSFFPQLVAGPIVRASEFLPQLEKEIVLTRDNMLVGSQLFLGGAIQKVLVADNLSFYVDPVFTNPDLYSSGTLWLALVGYSIQIFCDFSGYSLMAIGIARILGFELPVNFRMPYVSLSITEFWRRWHMTLSFWLRDYLYISLGGNRGSELRTRINLMLTMLLGGLWHGASWNFVLWGALHGLALIVHKYWSLLNFSFSKSKPYRLLAWITTFLFVLLVWLPFRSPNFETTKLYLIKLFNPLSDGVFWPSPSVILLIALVIAWHLLYKSKSRWLRSFPNLNPTKPVFLYPILISLLALLLFAPIDASPFIYFQF